MRINAFSVAMTVLAIPLTLTCGCQGRAADGRSAHSQVRQAPTGPGALGGAVGGGLAGARGQAAPARSFTVVATGDLLLHDQVTAQALADGRGQLDYRAILAPVKPVISAADLAICHLDTPLAPPLGPFRGRPPFSVPPQIVPALADLGYRTCSTASNHVLDQGVLGVARTLDDLDQAHIQHTGSARSAVEAATPNILDVRGVKVAHLAYTFGFTGSRLPAGGSWPANQINAGRILAAARLAREAGAQVVIVSMHWGTEDGQQPNAQQVLLAQQLLASADIDLIVGHHAHVVQPYARAAGGKWVAYGLGSLLAAPHGRQQEREGLIARFTFALSKGVWSVTRAEFIPTYIDQGPPLRVLNVPATLATRGLSAASRAFLQGIVDRTSRTVFSRSALPTLTAG